MPRIAHHGKLWNLAGVSGNRFADVLLKEFSDREDRGFHTAQPV
jgi:hypothetical protein